MKKSREQKEPTQRKTQHEDRDEDIGIDFSKAKDILRDFNKKVDMDKAVLVLFLLFSIWLVAFVRLQPLDLHVTDDWAASTINQNIRAQVAQQIDQQFPALPPQNKNALIDKRVAEIMTENADQFAQTQQQLSEQFKQQLRYLGDDGKEHTYLGDLDSYFWLRYTRNVLDHGSVCDEEIDGKCWDTYVLAPVGSEIDRNPSLHVFAIFGLYKAITIFNPEYPLPATSFLVSAIIGVLIVIPAFFIGRRLAGNVGGLFAAILIALHPLVLSRSIGSDNDAWNIALPMFVMWFIIEAIEAKSIKKNVIFAVLAAMFVGLHSATWEGWWFVYLIVLFALVGNLVYRIAVAMVRDRNMKPWTAEGFLHSGIATGVFYIATYFFLLLSSRADGYLSKPLAAFSSGSGLDRAIVVDYWPNVLTTVAELNKSSFAEAMNTMGGKFIFLGALAGLLLLIMPRTKWHWQHYTLFTGAMLINLYLVSNPYVTKLTALGLLMLPIGLTLLLYFTRDDHIDTEAALIILVWFLASVYATYSGVRFILLMVPAFGISFAVLAGRVHEWAVAFTSREAGWNRMLVSILVFAIIAFLLVQPVKAGHATARSFIPSIEDVWWDTLTKIDKEASPDAIINSWWDFGHWFKYVADRRVSADGTSQSSNVPRWLGLSLVTPDEKQSVGALRMLDCGSDTSSAGRASPHSAYGRAVVINGDSLRSEEMVRTILRMSRPDAERYLQSNGFTAEQARNITDASHCIPPEDFFITSSDMIGKAGVWAHFGMWNFTRSYIAANARGSDFSRKETVVQDFVTRFGMSREEAEAIYYDVRALTTENELNAFAAPWPGYITSNWAGCSVASNGSAIICPIGAGVGSQNGVSTVIDAFYFNVSNPNESRFIYGFYQNGQRVGVNGDGTPGSIIVAGNSSMREVTIAGANTPGVAVVMDTVNNRALLADPILARSTFTHLYYLDGRYAKYYKKFDERNGFSGTRIVVWKVDWDAVARDDAAAAQVATGATARITRK